MTSWVISKDPIIVYGPPKLFVIEQTRENNQEKHQQMWENNISKAGNGIYLEEDDLEKIFQQK